MEAFKLKDPNRTGYITALDFQYIMLKVKGHLLTSAAKDNLLEVNDKCKLITTFTDTLSFTGYRRTQSIISIFHGILLVVEQHGAN